MRTIAWIFGALLLGCAPEAADVSALASGDARAADLAEARADCFYPVAPCVGGSGDCPARLSARQRDLLVMRYLVSGQCARLVTEADRARIGRRAP